MTEKGLHELSRREREIMELVYRKGTATAAQIQAEMPGGLTNSTVRTLLRILESKGFLRHEKHDREYVYHPLLAKSEAQTAAAANLLANFCNNSLSQAVAALLDAGSARPDRDELERLAVLIEEARRREEGH